MVTKYNTNDKVWIMASIKSAMEVDGKIYYEVNESEYIVPEAICKKCEDKEIDALREERDNYRRAILGKGSAFSYSSLENLFQPE
ncbi:MAG: hypothetical protein IKO76_03380 [Butyrivibrio sp.]|nr:hypothetical protein [Butyrivibrio sp.]